MQIQREFSFEAAHSLPRVGPAHKCASVHGHSYTVTVTVQGTVDPTYGWVMDFADLVDLVSPFTKALDHHYLNDIEGLENPTAENLAVWFWRHLASSVPVSEVKVMETAHSGASYHGEDEPDRAS